MWERPRETRLSLVGVKYIPGAILYTRNRGKNEFSSSSSLAIRVRVAVSWRSRCPQIKFLLDSVVSVLRGMTETGTPTGRSRELTNSFFPSRVAITTFFLLSHPSIFILYYLFHFVTLLLALLLHNSRVCTASAPPSADLPPRHLAAVCFSLTAYTNDTEEPAAASCLPFIFSFFLLFYLLIFHTNQKYHPFPLLYRTLAVER